MTEVHFTGHGQLPDPEPREIQWVDYIGTKRVRAVPMTRLEYLTLREWHLPADENGEDPGYFIEYVDGGKPNMFPMFEGYVSWSPKDVFDRAYRPEAGIGSFSNALDAMKAGYRIARQGWNGKGMWAAVGSMKPDVIHSSQLNEGHMRDVAAANDDGMVTIRPSMYMRTANGEIVAWTASQTDILADDWIVLTS